ncbi:MAG: hypothetical protein O2801_09995, partial [Actinomycetota bacterium]|nr:hypothetical protein [Actinomycetota bacterium]
ENALQVQSSGTLFTIAMNVFTSFIKVWPQLVERFHGMEEVKGSIPFSSTIEPVGSGRRVLCFGDVLQSVDQ